MITEPLIYTNKGNVPLSSLDLKYYWEDGLALVVKPSSVQGVMQLSIEKDGQITYIEEYYLKGTDELVKRNVAIYRFKGLDVAADQSGIN